MRTVLYIISWLALAATIAPSMIYLGGAIDLKLMKAIMLGATFVWFLAMPLSTYFSSLEKGATL